MKTAADYPEIVYLLAYSTPVWATVVGGAFLILSLSVSLYLVFEHLSTYKNPEVPLFLVILAWNFIRVSRDITSFHFNACFT